MTLAITPLLGTASIWITPLWILGLGAIVGLLLCVVLWGAICLVSRPAGASVPMLVREGALWPIFCVATALGVVSIVATPIIFQPLELISSLKRLPVVGVDQFEFKVAAPATEDEDFHEPSQQKIDMSFRRSELTLLTFKAEEDLEISTRPESDADSIEQEGDERGIFKVSDGVEVVWYPSDDSVTFFPDEHVTALYVKNRSADEANLHVSIRTDISHPEMRTVPITALSIFFIFSGYLLISFFAPKVLAISLSTSKSEMAQPLYLVTLAIGFFLILASIWVPYNTFGEDVKMLKDSGLTLVLVLSVIVAIYAAGNSVAEEIEGRTALTVLSKPIGRAQFVFGKFLGIILAVSVIFVILGVLLLGTISYKVVYDARETSNPEPSWQESHLEMVRTVPGLVLGFLETVVLTALSVAISTRLPLLANFVVSFSIYVLGHLTPLIVQSAIGQEFAPVVFVGQLIATIVPVLDHFNIQAAVAAGVAVPYSYLFTSLVYCFLYSLIAMLLALTLFEDRDLA